jgi:hypothetical protein
MANWRYIEEPEPTAERPVAIYAIADEEGFVRYIGKANNVEIRLRQHAQSKAHWLPFYKWLHGFIAERGHINYSVLEYCTNETWQERERYWIARTDGLFNIQAGGNQPVPRNREAWYLKKQLGEALRRGFCTERTKAKMRRAARLNPELFGIWTNL